MTSTVERRANFWPHALACAVALVTFPLIWVGGLVTTYEAGMAVPDWPNTYGYNLFLYPWQTWLFGPWDLFIEHGHRLLGATVGLLTIGLCAALWWKDDRRWAKWLGLVALAGVIAQGMLGGMRVLLDERVLARLHGSVGPAFFAFAVCLVALTSRRWRSEEHALASPTAGRFQNLAVLTAMLAYLQLLIGAHLRHPSLDWSPSMFQAIVVFHLLFAAALWAHSLMLVARLRWLAGVSRAVARPAWILFALVTLQIGLGGLTWLENYGWYFWSETRAVAATHVVQAHSQWQALVTTAHVATGSLILATSALVALQSFRWLARQPKALRQPERAALFRGSLMPAVALESGVR